MKVAIVYDSRTGTTAQAAQSMRKVLAENGHHYSVQPVASANPTEATEEVTVTGQEQSG